MTSMVRELALMASQSDITIQELLRKALIIATRLAVPELIFWLNSELSGYKSGEVPNYRILQGQLKVENPYNGLQDFSVPPEINYLSTLPLSSSITEILHYVKKKDLVLYYFPQEVEKSLIKMMHNEHGISLRPVLVLPLAQMENIIENVRISILNWALDLESKGIIGEGMSITLEEKQTVKEQHYHFNNLSNSQVQISSQNSTQTQTTSNALNLESIKLLIEELSSLINKSTIETNLAEELKAELTTLNAQVNSPKPKWVIIKNTAQSIKNICEGAAGNLIAEISKPQLQTLINLATSTIF